MYVLQRILSSLKAFRVGIENILMWFPVIWRDRQFDYAYLEYLLLYKMELMYDHFTDPDKSMVDWEQENSGRALQALRICITILERRRDDFYTNCIWDSKDEELTDDVMVCLHKIERRDWKILHKLLEQYSEFWWD